MNLYDQKRAFAIKLGYKDLPTCFIEYGKKNFEARFNLLNRKSVVLKEINEKYTLYSDGEIYSDYYGKTIYPDNLKSKSGKIHPSYRLTLASTKKQKGFGVARLLKFYFGEHEYKKIEDMPPLFHKDRNSLNMAQDNLVFDVNMRMITDEARSKRKLGFNSKIPNDQETIDKITEQLKQKISMDAIGMDYGVTGMSIYRFKKRNNIEV